MKTENRDEGTIGGYDIETHTVVCSHRPKQKKETNLKIQKNKRIAAFKYCLDVKYT